MNQREMMEVNGGARSRSDRRAAQRAANANRTRSNLKEAVFGMGSYAGLIGFAVAAATGPIGVTAAASVISGFVGFVSTYR